MRVALSVSCLVTTARWYGENVPTVSTSTASWNGSTLSKCIISAPCVVRTGSLKLNSIMASLDGLPPLPKSLSGLNLQEYQTLQHGSPRSCSLSSESGHFASARSSRSTPRDLTPSSSFSRSARGSPVTRPPPPPPRHRHEPPRGRLFTLDSQLAVLRKEMVRLQV